MSSVSINELALACLSYTQQADATLSAPTTTQQKAFIARAINGALDEIRALNPAPFRTRWHSLFSAPTTCDVTLGVDLDKIVAYSGSALPSWLAPGQVVTFGGTTFTIYNILNAPAPTGSCAYLTPAASTLTAGKYTATFYCNSVIVTVSMLAPTSLDADVAGPVLLDDQTELIGAGSLDRLRRLAFHYGAAPEFSGDDYGARVSSSDTDDYGYVFGTPGFWCASTGGLQQTSSTTAKYTGQALYTMLHVAPVPTAACSVTYWLGQNSRAFTSTDLSDTTLTIEMPGGPGAAASILTPLVLLRWASSPWCRIDPQVYRQLAAEAETARAILARARGTHGPSQIISGY